MRVLVIHGPNLNLLGRREVEVYGTTTLAEVNAAVEAEADQLGITVEIHQTAREGEIIEFLHAALDRVDGCLLNPAAYSHTSRAIAEAVAAVPYPVIEVHLSNIHSREPWRRRSVTAEEALGIVSGFGSESYLAGLNLLKRIVGR